MDLVCFMYACTLTHVCALWGKDVLFAEWVHLVNTKDWNIDPKSPRVLLLIVTSKNTDKNNYKLHKFSHL